MSLQEISHVLYQIKLADQKIVQIFEENIGVSLTRYEILMCLKEENPLLQNSLQEKLLIDQAAITRHLKVLEADGYVTRCRNPKNNREIFVSLTEKSQQKIAECEAKHQEAGTVLSPAFTEGEMEQLLVLLDKLNNQLCEYKTKEVK
ncbi:MULTISPECIES: MarR family transcriptional regulator [unclassified Enterococcus]|uniref:MarR family winged helix-turn-helix transcriptional regulator n=1 Tax=unclassified Enterococcus TaxID=2608891 RepID=UPI0013ED1B18|nr:MULTISPECIES: MarR family transcriptional regulator [unclassified Enterococcus]